MACVIDASAPTMVFSSNEPITKMTIKHNDYHSETHIREGNAILTHKYIKKNKKMITTQNAGCNCGWECVSNNKSEMKLKARLHTKVCPLKK